MKHNHNVSTCLACCVKLFVEIYVELYVEAEAGCDMWRRYSAEVRCPELHLREEINLMQIPFHSLKDGKFFLFPVFVPWSSVLSAYLVYFSKISILLLADAFSPRERSIFGHICDSQRSQDLTLQRPPASKTKLSERSTKSAFVFVVQKHRINRIRWMEAALPTSL